MTTAGGAGSPAAFHDGFKAPTLRNVTVTAPYMHDGALATLDAVIDHHATRGAMLTPGQRADLLAFLDALTDRALVTDPRLADPWR